MKDEFTVIRLRAEEKAELKQYAKKNGLTMSEIIRKMVLPIVQNQSPTWKESK